MPLVTRFMFLPNAGEGNPHQYPIISPTGDINYHVRPNYRLTAINCDNGSENFVVFARPDRPIEGCRPGINNGDLINLFDFIYGTVLQRLFVAPGAHDRLIVELDVSSCDGVIEMIRRFSEINPDHVISSIASISPMARALGNELRAMATCCGREITVSLVNRTYTADECRAYFFPDCEGECHCGR